MALPVFVSPVVAAMLESRDDDVTIKPSGSVMSEERQDMVLTSDITESANWYEASSTRIQKDNSTNDLNPSPEWWSPTQVTGGSRLTDLCLETVNELVSDWMLNVTAPDPDSKCESAIDASPSLYLGEVDVNSGNPTKLVGHDSCAKKSK